MKLGDFPARTSPCGSSMADPRCWCAHQSPPWMGVWSGAAASKPQHPSLGCGAHKRGFWGVCCGPPKTRAGHVALSPHAASLRLLRAALREIKRSFRGQQLLLALPAFGYLHYFPIISLEPGEITFWGGDMPCRCHGPAAQSHGSARCSPPPAPLSQLHRFFLHCANSYAPFLLVPVLPSRLSPPTFLTKIRLCLFIK